jgi:hypothetical protein
MITKIDKDGNAFGSPSIIVIKSDGKVKTVGGGTVTDVTATSPLSSTGGTTPNISIPQATSLQDGFLRSGDWTFFNSKQDALVSGTNIKTVNGNTLLGSGDLTISASSSITVGTTPITSGVDGRVLFQSGGVVSQDSGFTWDNTNKRLGVGTSTPSYPLHVSGIFDTVIKSQTTSNSFSAGLNLRGGVGSEWSVYTQRNHSSGNVSPLVFKNSINNLMLINTNGNVGIGTVNPQARLDVRAQGALSTDVAFRVRNSADTLNIIKAQGDGNVFVGIGAGNSSTGANVTALGVNSLRNNTSGSHNTSFGHTALFSITTAVANTAMGSLALTNLTSGDNNIAFGFNSGRYISSGANLTISNSSLFIGNGTRPNADNQTNQIVIGNGATGLGSNTVVLGNDSIVTTQLRGTVRLSLQASAPTGVEGAIYYDSTTKKHYGHNGTAWNALY